MDYSNPDRQDAGRNASDEEMQRYREKLAQWRDMGFDVSALEILLETDFEAFKQQRFDFLRKQIGAAKMPRHPAAEVTGADKFSRSPGLQVTSPGRIQIGDHQSNSTSAPANAPAPYGHHSGISRAASSDTHDHAVASEMRYPSIRRRHHTKKPRAFSFSVEEPVVAVISVGEVSPRPKKVARAAQTSGKPGPRPAKGPERAAPTVPRKKPAISIDSDGPEDDTDEVELSADDDDSPDEPGDTDTGDDGLTRRSGDDDADYDQTGEEDASEEDHPAGDEGDPGPEYDEPSGKSEDEYDEGSPPITGRTPMARPSARVARPLPARPPLKKRRRRKNSLLPVLVVIAIMVPALGAAWAFYHPVAGLQPRILGPASVSAGELVSFDGSKSKSPDRITSYLWNFGDETTGAGKNVTHFYAAAGPVTVSLRITTEKGAAATTRIKVNVGPLAITVPAKHLDDKAYYAVSGSATARNTDTYLYTFPVGGTVIHVTEVSLEFSGTLDQWVREQMTKEDGFGKNHSALRQWSKESLTLNGNATTVNAGKAPLYGTLGYTEDAYSDPATGGVFQVYAVARTSLSIAGGIIENANYNSTDTLRAYPSVATISDQFQTENIYKGRRFDQSNPSSLSGTLRAGNSSYSWIAQGVTNINGRASVKLHVVLDNGTMQKYGFTDFYMDVYVSANSSLPMKTHVHVAGRSGDGSYISDHIAEMTGFSGGKGAIDSTPQTFLSGPLPAEMFSAPFGDVPPAGPSHGFEFSPAEAREAAIARNGDFSKFISDNPQSYIVSAKYLEGWFGAQSAVWNLTASWPGATIAYYVNVTRDILSNYSVRGDWVQNPPDVTSQESAFSKMLTLSSAEMVFRNDTESAKEFFDNGTIRWTGGTTFSLEADTPYPGLNLAQMYASGERAGYAAILRRGAYTSALSMDSGQMLYFWVHTT